MAFGKADVGLIQADRAAQKIDPNLGIGMAVDKTLDGMKQAAAAQSTAMKKYVQNSDGVFDKAIAKHQTGDDSLKPIVQDWMTTTTTAHKGDHANSNNQISRSKSLNSAKEDIVFGNELNSYIVQTIENNGVMSPGMNKTDQYFSKQFGGQNFEITSQDGVRGISIPNENGNGSTFFDRNNLPVGFSKFNEGSTAILGIWNKQFANNTDYSKLKNPGTDGEYKDALLISNNGKPPNYHQTLDLITQDHSKDGVDNPFMKQFKSGVLDPSFYQNEDGTYISVNGKTYSPDASLNYNTMDPRGGLSEQDLEDFLRNKNSEGTVEYQNRNNHVNFVVDKYSKFMGTITNDEYENKQQELMKQNQTYFNNPNEDGSFSTFFTTKGVEPKVNAVKTRKNTVNNSMRFDAATTAYIGTGVDNRGGDGAELQRVTNWNSFDFESQLNSTGKLDKNNTEKGDFVSNLMQQYKGSDVEFEAAEKGVLTINMPNEEGNLTRHVYDFTKGDKNDVMKELKSQLNLAVFSAGSGADALGNDASTWYDQLNKKNKRIETKLN